MVSCHVMKYNSILSYVRYTVKRRLGIPGGVKGLRRDLGDKVDHAGTLGSQGKTRNTRGSQRRPGISKCQGETRDTRGSQGTQGRPGRQGRPGTQGVRGRRGIPGSQRRPGISKCQGETRDTRGSQGTQGRPGRQQKRGSPRESGEDEGHQGRVGGSSKVLVRPCARAPSYGSARAHALRRGRPQAHAVRTYVHA